MKYYPFRIPLFFHPKLSKQQKKQFQNQGISHFIFAFSARKFWVVVWLIVALVLFFAETVFPAQPTTGQLLFQQKAASGPYTAFGVTPVTNQAFGWDGTKVVMLGPGGGTSWGGITGTLSAQTDLQNALNAKLSLSGVLPLAGFSSITGTLPIANLPGTVQLTNGTLALGGFGAITGTLADARLSANVQLKNGTLALGTFGSITGTVPAVNIGDLSGTYLTLSAAAAGYQPLDGDLTAISALSGTNNIYYRSAANTWTPVTVGTGLSFGGGTLANTVTGTVTSVALSAPSIFSVTGSPVTTTGTLALSLSNQTANRIWAGPTTGGATTPAFRALVSADIPDLSAMYVTPAAVAAAYQPLDADLTAIAALSGTNTVYYRSAANTWTPVAFGSGMSFSGGTISATGTGGTVSSVAVTMPSIFSVTGSPITTTGTIAASLVNQSAHTFFSGSATTGASTPAFRVMVAADVPDLSATYLTPAAAAAAYQPLDGDLTAIAALTGTNNIYYRSAANTWSSVTLGTGLSFSAGSLTNTGVTSVAISLPSILSVSGSPVTTTGTLTATLATQTAKTILAGPTSGGVATPTFRLLVSGDIPDISASYTTPAAVAAGYQPLDGDLTAISALSGTNNIYYRSAANTWTPVAFGSGISFSAGTLSGTGTGTVTSVGLTAPGIFSVTGSPVTTVGSLTLNLATQTANRIWAGPTSGGVAAPAFRALVAADMPTFSSAQLASFLTDETGTGLAVFGTSPTLTTPRFADLGYIADSTGAKILVFDSTAVAVNQLQISNASSGSEPIIQSTGTDTNIGLTLLTKGAGTITFNTTAENFYGPAYISAESGPNAAFKDINRGTNLLSFSGQDDADNWILIGNAPSGDSPFITVSGNTDANIDLVINTSGTGKVLFPSGVKISGGLYDGTGSAGTSGQFAKSTGTGWIWSSAGTGTVSSVALALPSIFSVSGSPVTTTGTLTGTLATQTANAVFAGPTTGGATTPTFRSLVAGDIPAINLLTGITGTLAVTNGGTGQTSAQAAINAFANAGGAPTTGDVLKFDGTNWLHGTVSGTGTVTSVGLTAPSFLSVAGTPVTGAGTLAMTLATQTANTVFAGPTSGGVAAPTYRALVAADMPNTAVTPGSYTNTNITVDAQGHITAAASGSSGATLAANTFTGQQILSVNGAASTPPLSLSGSWFSGGSGSTTKPQVQIQSSAITTQNGWSTNGTALGINAAAAFTGNLIDAQLNATSQFSVASTGNIATAGILTMTGTGISTSAGLMSFTGAGIASNPTLKVNGSWFSGGSATTTKPAFLVESSGVSNSNGWNTAGTGIGINAAASFTGNLIDAQLNSTAEFSVSSSGDVSTAGNITTSTVGKTLRVKSGSNSKAGTFTLTSGAATVANTSWTANSVMVCSLKTTSGTVLGNPYVASSIVGTSFTVTAGAADNSTYNYVILEVN